MKSGYSYYNKNKPLFNNLTKIRLYSASSKYRSISLPVPIVVFDKLGDKNSILSSRNLLRNKGGVYCFTNRIKNKKYVGSAKDLYLRLVEHINNKKSNVALQKAIEKYGLNNFYFSVFEYFSYDSKIVSNKALTDLETNYIKKFDFNTLYNFMRTATSLEGYKHTQQAKMRMIARFKDKYNHPMFGK